MASFIFGVIMAGITLLAIGLQRTYYHYPAKELKRRARAGDSLAKALYRPVSYGVSLRVLLWLIVTISAALAFVLLSRSLNAFFAVIVIALLVGVGFLWLPSAALSAFSTRLALMFTPAVSWLVSLLHPWLHRVGVVVNRFRTVTVHTGLYEKDDLVELLERQRKSPDNRIQPGEIHLLQHALSFGDRQVAEILIPARAVKLINESDPIGPTLMDELYKSGHSRFPVYSGESTNIVGTLSLRDLVNKQSQGSVKDVMRPEVFYVHQDFTLYQALQAFIKTKHHLFVVVNSFEEFVGIVTIEDILEQVIGKPIVDEFDRYDNLRAVAGRNAKVEHANRQKANKEPDKETTDSETPDIVVK